MPQKPLIGTHHKLYKGHFPGHTSFVAPGLSPLKTPPHIYRIFDNKSINTDKFVSGPGRDEVAQPKLTKSLEEQPTKDEAQSKEVLPEKIVFKVRLF